MSPLLAYGIAFFLGMLFQPYLLIPFFALIYFSGLKRGFLIALVAGTGYFTHQTARPAPPSTAICGEGQLHINEIIPKSVFGKKKMLYKGVFKTFQTEDKRYKNLPVLFYLSDQRPSADRDWIVRGTLTPPFFTPEKNTSWLAVKGTFSLAEIRLYLKESVKGWVFKNISDKNSALLLSGLITGDFDDRELKKAFSNLGLSHLLAISGFHFSIVALILAWLLKPFLSLKSRAKGMLVMLSLYCLFLGGSPSVLRAFIALSLFLLAPLFQAASNSKNALGAALLIILAIDPMAAENIGFQLSFLATGAILFGFLPAKAQLDALFPSQSKAEIYKLSKFDRGVKVVLSQIKNVVALNLTISFVLFPVLLKLFQTFPLASLVYNLFFPFLITLSIFLLILSILLPFLHPLNSAYTAFLLDLAKEAPVDLIPPVKVDYVPETFIIIYLTLVFSYILHKNNSFKYTISEINL
ncbi:MAG: ComEC/Rec2 family competence protein [Chlamydiia bacterium]|nr:ComEC/Rec2 family competence protein [Chlamydiia bacterium]